MSPGLGNGGRPKPRLRERARRRPLVQGRDAGDGRHPSPVTAPNPGPKIPAALRRAPPCRVPQALPVPVRCPRLTRHGPDRPRGPARCPDRLLPTRGARR